MKPPITVRKAGNGYLIFETRTHVLEDWIFCSCDHSGVRILVRADSDFHFKGYNTRYYLDMSILDDDDFDYTVEFPCFSYSEFIYKLELLIDWMNDISGCYVFYGDLLASIPIYN